jgi:hypothetical protein
MHSLSSKRRTEVSGCQCGFAPCANTPLRLCNHHNNDDDGGAFVCLNVCVSEEGLQPNYKSVVNDDQIIQPFKEIDSITTNAPIYQCCSNQDYEIYSMTRRRAPSTTRVPRGAATFVIFPAFDAVTFT